MYYYGYNGYGSGNPCCGNNGGGYGGYPQYGYPANGGGYGAAIILVLFILLVIVFGAGFLNYGNNNQ